MEIIKYKINEGSVFGWSCYGKNAYVIDSYRKNGSLQLTFDTVDQTVYEFAVCDYKENKAYNWTNPKFDKKHKAESKKRGFANYQAWDDVEYLPVSSVEIIKIANLVSSKR